MRYELFGWTMFLVSGIFFLVIGIRDDDLLVIGSAIVWMIGCLAFLAATRR